MVKIYIHVKKKKKAVFKRETSELCLSQPEGSPQVAHIRSEAGRRIPKHGEGGDPVMTKFIREQTEMCVQLHPTSPHGMRGGWAVEEPHDVSDQRGMICVCSAAKVFLSSVSSHHPPALHQPTPHILHWAALPAATEPLRGETSPLFSLSLSRRTLNPAPLRSAAKNQTHPTMINDIDLICGRSLHLLSCLHVVYMSLFMDYMTQ